MANRSESELKFIFGAGLFLGVIATVAAVVKAGIDQAAAENDGTK